MELVRIDRKEALDGVAFIDVDDLLPDGGKE
jgi:hypothetical protein